MSLAQTVVPGVSKRDEYQLVGDKCALLIVDVQKYLSEDLSSSQEMTPEKHWFYEDACPAAVSNIVKIVEAFRLIRDDKAGRKSGYEVLFTYLQSATKDGRDVSLDYKLSGSQLSKIPHVGTDYDDVFLTPCNPTRSQERAIFCSPRPVATCSFRRASTTYNSSWWGN